MGKCDKCHEEYEKVGKCKSCKVAKYCSLACQKEDWAQHKKVCERDTKMLKKIMNKLQKRGLYRHVNGNTMDNRIQNIQKVSLADALRHGDWIVDACFALEEDEYLHWEKIRGNEFNLPENQYAVVDLEESDD